MAYDLRLAASNIPSNLLSSITSWLEYGHSVFEEILALSANSMIGHIDITDQCRLPNKGYFLFLESCPN